jgi:hypothetical protein
MLYRLFLSDLGILFFLVGCNDFACKLDCMIQNMFSWKKGEIKAATAFSENDSAKFSKKKIGSDFRVGSA